MEFFAAVEISKHTKRGCRSGKRVKSLTAGFQVDLIDIDLGS